MLKAASLFYALILMLLIGIVISVLLLYSGADKLLKTKLEIENELIDFSDSSMVYGLANYSELDTVIYNENPFDNGFLFSLEKKKWGYLDVLYSKVYFKKDTLFKTAFIGNSKKKTLALYLSDFEKPLSLFKTKILGDCKLPYKGYRKLQISNSLSGKNTVTGNISHSSEKLPKFNNLFKVDFNLYSKLNYSDIDTSNKLINSFSKEGIAILMNTNINLENINISGKYLIKALDSICIKNTAKLDNVIIQSPKVFIETGFRGNIQIFATKSVTLEDHVQLDNPSLIYLQNDRRMKEAVINIGKSSIVDGGIIIYGKTEDVNTNYLNIEKEAKITGTVYCNGNTQLKGKILGTIYTDKFYLDTGESKYSNAIKEGEIIMLPKDFVYINYGISTTNHFKILKWLN